MRLYNSTHCDHIYKQKIQLNTPATGITETDGLPNNPHRRHKQHTPNIATVEIKDTKTGHIYNYIQAFCGTILHSKP